MQRRRKSDSELELNKFLLKSLECSNREAIEALGTVLIITQLIYFYLYSTTLLAS